MKFRRTLSSGRLMAGLLALMSTALLAVVVLGSALAGSQGGRSGKFFWVPIIIPQDHTLVVTFHNSADRVTNARVIFFDAFTEVVIESHGFPVKDNEALQGTLTNPSAEPLVVIAALEVEYIEQNDALASATLVGPDGFIELLAEPRPDPKLSLGL